MAGKVLSWVYDGSRGTVGLHASWCVHVIAIPGAGSDLCVLAGSNEVWGRNK